MRFFDTAGRETQRQERWCASVDTPACSEKPASFATRSEPLGLSSSGGNVCNVPTVGALGEDFPALLRAQRNAVGDRMPLQLHHRVVVIRLQRQVAALSIALEESSFLQESGYTVTDAQNRDRQRIYTSKF
jgi:hypothetical protein